MASNRDTLVNSPSVGLRFRDNIQKAVNLGDHFTKSYNPFLNYNFKAIKPLLSEIKSLLVELEVHKKEIEAHSKSPKLNYELYQQIETHVNKIQSLNTDLNTLKREYGEQKEQIRDEKFGIQEEIVNIQNNELINIATDIEKDNKIFNQLYSEQKQLLQRQSTIETRLANKKCGCFPFFYTQDRNTLKQITQQLKLLNERIKKSNHHSPHNFDSPRIKNLKDRRISLDSQLQQITEEDYPTSKEAIETQINTEKMNLAIANIELKDNIDTLACSVSNKLMLKGIRSLVYIKTLTDNLKKLVQQNLKNIYVKTFLDEIEIVQLNLTKVIFSMWCPEANDKTGEQVFSDYNKMTQKDKNDFLKGNITEGNLAILLPNVVGTKTEILHTPNLLYRSLTNKSRRLEKAESGFVKSSRNPGSVPHEELPEFSFTKPKL